MASELALLFPAPDSSSGCPDPALRLTFVAPVSLGSAGHIRVFDAAQPRAAVADIDMAAPAVQGEIAGRGFQLLRPVFLEGNTAVVALPSGALTPGHAFYVNVDAGVFLDGGGQPLPGLADASAWRFTTAVAAPANSGQLVVAQDGSGDFCSVQGAVDHVPPANAERVVIEIKSGVYREIVFINQRPLTTLRGESRSETIISYPNNDALQNKLGSKFRALVNAENASGLIVENLTLHNSTPQNGSQAEALRVDGSDQVIVRQADFKSLQDTLQLSGRVYVHDCLIEGNVDYVWGKGTAYFERCELKTVGRAGYDVQARNEGNYGYVFVDSKLTADPGLSGHILARIEADRFPQSHVAYVDCAMGPHIAPEGFLVTSGSDTSRLRFWEFGSKDLDGQPLDVSKRNAITKQLSPSEAETMRDRAHVLSGWDPTAEEP